MDSMSVASLVLLVCLALQCHMTAAFLAAGAHTTPPATAAAARAQQCWGRDQADSQADEAACRQRRVAGALRRPRSSQLHALDPSYVDAVNEIFSGVAGGTVGVMGTLIALELKKQNVEKRSVCPYCQGAGTLTCARCYGSGVRLVARMGASAADTLRLSVPCACCTGTGGVTCNICRGDGASVPPLLENKGGYEAAPNGAIGPATARLGRMPPMGADEADLEEEEALSPAA